MKTTLTLISLLIILSFNAQNLVVDNSKSDKAIVKKATDDYKSYYENGLKNYNIKNFELALEYFEKSISSRNIHFNSHFYRALTLYNLNKNEESLKAFQSILELDGTFYVSYIYTSKIYIRLQKFDLALNDINTYMIQNRHSHEGNYVKASVLYELKNYNKAYDEMMIALESCKTNGEYYLLSGKIRLALKMKNTACVNFKKAIDLQTIEAIEYQNQYCLSR